MNRLLKSSSVTGWLLASPLVLVLAMFLIPPVMMIVVVSLWQATEFSIVLAFDFGDYEFLFGSAVTCIVFLNTFRMPPSPRR